MCRDDDGTTPVLLSMRLFSSARIWRGLPSALLSLHDLPAKRAIPPGPDAESKSWAGQAMGL